MTRNQTRLTDSLFWGLFGRDVGFGHNVAGCSFTDADDRSSERVEQLRRLRDGRPRKRRR